MLRLLLSPRLIGLHLAALVAVGAAAWLGLWQYGAWEIRRSDAAAQLASRPAVPLTRLMGPDDPFPAAGLGRQVRFRGAWLPDDSFLVANRRLGGNRGYWAVTPVAVCQRACAGDPAMLVVRGWTANRRAVPPPPDGRVQVLGWLQPPGGSGRPDPNPADDVLPELRIADVIQRLDRDIYGGYVIAHRTAPADSVGAAAASVSGDLRAVSPAAEPEPQTFTALRNLLYALEWWVFGGFAVVLWWRLCTDAARRREQPPAEHRPTATEVASRP